MAEPAEMAHPAQPKRSLLGRGRPRRGEDPRKRRTGDRLRSPRRRDRLRLRLRVRRFGERRDGEGFRRTGDRLGDELRRLKGLRGDRGGGVGVRRRLGRLASSGERGGDRSLRLRDELASSWTEAVCFGDKARVLSRLRDRSLVLSRRGLALWFSDSDSLEESDDESLEDEDDELDEDDEDDEDDDGERRRRRFSLDEDSFFDDLEGDDDLASLFVSR
ncbi:hypothetical protein DYB28_015028, partial [Aphanomyces astaci]